MTELPAPFFLIVSDLDQRFFSVEGPMTDDRPWSMPPAMFVTNFSDTSCVARLVQIEPSLAAEFRRAHKLAGFHREAS